jgi:hypothetical protein
MRPLTHRLQLHRLQFGGGLITTILFSASLVGCGAASGAAASGAAATSTCPPTSTFKTVTGHITAVGSGAITVTDSSGAATQVHVTSTTRVTRIALLSPTALTAGTSVLVVTDTNATIAQRISVLAQGAAGTGGPGFGSGRFSGTPSAGSNAACARRQGQGFGQGFGQGSGFQGLRGTVDSATSTKLVFDDVQGQTYSVAITSATVIQQTAQAQTSDLKVGLTVTAIGSVTSTGMTARTITIQP